MVLPRAHHGSLNFPFTHPFSGGLLRLSNARAAPLLSPRDFAAWKMNVAFHEFDNRSSKIYHLPNCPDYGNVSERNRAPFASEAEAVKVGIGRRRTVRNERLSVAWTTK